MIESAIIASRIDKTRASDTHISRKSEQREMPQIK
jgi:hypothetical protein